MRNEVSFGTSQVDQVAHSDLRFDPQQAARQKRGDGLVPAHDSVSRPETLVIVLYVYRAQIDSLRHWMDLRTTTAPTAHDFSGDDGPSRDPVVWGGIQGPAAQRAGGGLVRPGHRTAIATGRTV